MSSEHHDPFALGSVDASIDATDPQREILLAIELGGERATLAYNEVVSLHVRERVPHAHLEHALRELVRRHESLRGRFSRDWRTLVIAGRDEPAAITTHDLSGLEPGARRDRHAALCEREVRTPFDLVAGPLARFQLLDHGPGGGWDILISAHHAVCDGWSLGVLVDELATLLRGASLEPAPSFVDYAQRARQSLQDTAADTAEIYWAEAIGSPPPVLDLPTDRTRSQAAEWSDGIPVRSLNATRLDHRLDPLLRTALEERARESNASLSALMLAAFATYLRRLTGQDDFLVGVPAAGQANDGDAGLVGHCVHLLPIRMNCAAAASIEELARATRMRLLDGFEHQSVSFHSIVQRLAVERDPLRVPLIPVLFNLDQQLDLGAFGEGARLDTVPRVADQFEWFLNATPVGNELVLESTYSTDLFDRASIGAWMEGFEAMLRALVASQPDTPWRDHPVVSSGQRAAQLCIEQPGGPVDVSASSRGRTTLDRIRSQIAERPDRVTVVDEDGTTLTYAELGRRAAAIATELGELEREARVGVHLDRSSDLLVVLLGIWIANGTYVPLDPDYPPARLAMVAEDAELTAVVADRPRTTWISPSCRWIVPGASDGSGPARVGTEDSALEPEHAAYLLHTSGSTGRPKGVVVEHAALDNFLAAMSSELGMGPGHEWLAVTALSFDISALELFLPLTVGARVRIARSATVRDGRSLARTLANAPCDFLQMTPSGWRSLIDGGWQGTPGLHALSGGEALAADLATTIASRVETLWNLYGPTEATIWATIDRYDTDQPVSIGRPIENMRAFVLDEDGNLLAPGSSSGELYLGGLGLARGYWNRPEETAARFLPTPSADFGTPRMYRTGDRVRRAHDGRLYFLGRTDDQVKVRGHRIELGEIETVLRRTPGVRDAAARSIDFGGGDVRLAGYVVVAPNTPFDAASCLARVRAELPRHSVPQHVEVVGSLPRTANGKLDRNALPVPGASRAPAQNPSNSETQPRSDTERSLAEIWRETLHNPAVGAGTDFFEVGGHSLSAMRMLARVRDTFGVELPLNSVFVDRDLASLAARIEVALLRADPRQDSSMARYEF